MEQAVGKQVLQQTNATATRQLRGEKIQSGDSGVMEGPGGGDGAHMSFLDSFIVQGKGAQAW